MVQMVTSCLSILLLAVVATNALKITMPGARPEKDDDYLCTRVDVSNGTLYLREFKQVENRAHAHHVLLFGCTKPGSEAGIWSCGGMGDVSPCESEQTILFSWAMDAPGFKLPKDVSYKVGQGTSIKHLVMQVHYKKVADFFKDPNLVDKATLVIVDQTEPTPLLAGMYLLIGSGGLMPHSESSMSTACEYNRKEELIPLAYRVHAHKMGRTITGSMIDSASGKITKLGEKSAQEPQTFYPVLNDAKGITIKEGDQLTATCNFHNPTDHTVYMGDTAKDEMCNFYLMYAVPNGSEEASETILCSSMATAPLEDLADEMKDEEETFFDKWPYFN